MLNLKQQYEHEKETWINYLLLKPEAMVTSRAVAITAISQYRAFESITAEECNNRSNRDISFFFFFCKVMPFSFYT